MIQNKILHLSTQSNVILSNITDKLLRTSIQSSTFYPISTNPKPIEFYYFVANFALWPMISVSWRNGQPVVRRIVHMIREAVEAPASKYITTTFG